MVKISGSLDSKKTQDMVKAHLDRFGLDLDKNIVACTSDGAAVMVKFGREIMPLHQQCIAHCLHLAVCDV
jgi:hypothetical protein